MLKGRALKPLIPLFIAISILAPSIVQAGGLHFGIINAIESKLDELKEKVKEKREEEREVIIPETTKVLSESTVQRLSSVDASTLTFDGSTSDLESLSPGDVVVINVSPLTPYGLLRRVTNVTASGNQIIVETTSATLTDAIQRGKFELSKVLSYSDISATITLMEGVVFKRIQQPQALEGFYVEIRDVVLYDHDRNFRTTNDQIEADGSISFNPSFVFKIGIDNFQLKELTFTCTITETAELKLSTGVDIIDIQKKVEIARYRFKPFTVWVGWVPVVITPVLTVNVGFDGNVSIGIETKVTQQATLTAGLGYHNGAWSPISSFSNNFGFEPPSLSVGCRVKGYAGPQLTLLVYEIAGPYGEVNGYLELEADLLRRPWWELYAGLEVGVGVRVEILSRLITDYNLPAVIGYRLLLAQAETGAPGSISGSVKDAITQSPLQGVSVNVYDQGSVVSTGSTGSDGTYSLPVPVGSGYRVEFSKPGYIPATYYNVSVAAGNPTYLETILQIDTNYSGTGNISGKIVNALDGIGVSGLTINLREGINVTTGIIVATTTTGGGGSYSFTNLNAGSYTAEASGSGYNITYFTVICIGGTTTGDQNATITPTLAPGETRIILTWGATPSDLDSHLTGPRPDGGRFHIYFANKTHTYLGTKYADLDLDDVTSYGPETTTIYQQIGGMYRFSVHDYSNRSSTNSYALSNSGAQVRVYRGSNLVANFNVPPNQEGTLWTVFELSGDTITPINTMSYVSSPGDIQSLSFRGRTDAELMRNLPAK